MDTTLVPDLLEIHSPRWSGRLHTCRALLTPTLYDLAPLTLSSTTDSRTTFPPLVSLQKSLAFPTQSVTSVPTYCL